MIKATLGTDKMGTRFFLAGDISDHYHGLRDFPDHAKRFGLGRALSSDMQLFKKRLNETMPVVPLITVGVMGCYSQSSSLLDIKTPVYETSTYAEGKDTLWIQGIDQNGDGKSEILTLMKISKDSAGNKFLLPHKTLHAKDQDFALWEARLRTN